MNRFRANIVIDGLEAFQEHEASSFIGEDFELRVRYPCERCVVTTIDQDRGEKHPAWEPFNSLKNLNPSPHHEGKPVFGVYATLERGDGATLQLNQEISITTA